MADRTSVLRVDPDEMPERVLVMGDPARAELASRRLEGRRPLGSFREYVTYGGTHRGVEVAVTSHGVGSPGAVIAFEELSRAGVRRIIRTGTCGGLAAEVQDGDLVIVTGAIRADGVTDAMVPTPFPALASVDLVTAIRRAVASTDHRSHEGVVLTPLAVLSGRGARGRPGVLEPGGRYRGRDGVCCPVHQRFAQLGDHRGRAGGGRQSLTQGGGWLRSPPPGGLRRGGGDDRHRIGCPHRRLTGRPVADTRW